MKFYRSAGAAVLALVAGLGAAYSAGYFPGFPIVGSPSYCTSYSGTGGGTGSSTWPGNAPFGQNCNSTAPAGPASTTGMELMPADTQLLNGQQPQTVLIPSSLVGSLNVRINRLIGGDFTTNLWQRGTTFTALTPTTTAMTADRWGVYSSGNTVTVTQQIAAADQPTTGMYASMRVSRPSGTNTSAICVGQVLDKNAAGDLIGKNGVFSFYALAGAALNTVASNNVTATVAYYTAADSATPGTNTDAFMKGTITGYTAAVAGGSQGTTASVTSGAATINIGTTWTRYAVYASIPTTNASGTAVTGVGVTLCYTPASGTGGSTEWFEFGGAQLQAMPSTSTANMPNGITNPSGFERRSPQVEADYQLYYSQVLTDGAATNRYAMGQSTTTTASTVVVPLQPMRIVPATTVATAASFATTIPAGTAQNCTTLAAVATSNTKSSAALSCTVAANMVAGSATQLIGQATGALVTFSAEP